MFPLSRIYSWVSLFSILITAALLSVIYHYFAIEHLKSIGERDAVALTQSFANTLGPELVDWVEQAALMPAEKIKANKQTQELLAQAKRQMRGTDVSKIKIYAMNGKTIFSSEIKQIGEDKSKNDGYLAARSGKVAAELTHRDQFSAFERVIVNRNLLAIYIPIRDPETGKVEVVFELYNDVTELLEALDRTGRWVTGAVLLAMATLFVLLFLVVKYADRRMRTQHDQLRADFAASAATGEEFEQQVKALTAQLDKSNAGLSAAWRSVQQADQTRAEVLSMIANAIREPMTGVVNASRQLADTRLDASQRSSLDTVLSSSEQLRKSVERLLERANLHKPAPEPQQFVPGEASPSEPEFKLS